MADETVVKGLSDLQRFLDQLAPNVEANIMRGALRAGANVFLEEAQSRVPKKTGNLRSSLKISTRLRDHVVTASVRTADHIARFVEFGTRPHYISVQDSEKPVNVRRSARAGRLVRASMTTVNRNVLKIGAHFVGPTVHHPGAKPNAFMRTTLDMKANAAVVAVGEYIKDRLATQQGFNTSSVLIQGDER